MQRNGIAARSVSVPGRCRLPRRFASADWRAIAAAYWLVALSVLLYAASSASAQQVAGQYIVRLRTEPVIRHLLRSARIAGLSSASPLAQPAERVNLFSDDAATHRASDDAATHRALLRDEQDSLRARIAKLPGATVIGQTDWVLNSLTVNIRTEDVDTLRRMPEVAEVYPSVLYHKTMDAALELVRASEAWNSRVGGEANAGAGVKIGILDTGLDINHPMLQDPALVAPAGFPKFTQSSNGICVPNDRQFTNTKVIVARNYVHQLPSFDPNCDAMDRDGHGTFTSTVAGGRRVAAPLASIAGVAPKAFLGNYKVFGTPGFNDSASLSSILAALNDAVADGMNVINLSLGAQLGLPPSADPLAIAVKTAVEAGVVVVVAAGNDGPGSGTISSPGIAPEAITVGSSTNSRTLAFPLEIRASIPVPSALQLIAATPGNGPAITAEIGPLPIRDSASLNGNATACTAFAPGSLTGQMVLIERGGCSFQIKIISAISAGAVAVVLFNQQANQAAISFTVGAATQIPSVMIGNSEGLALRRFLSTSDARTTARIGAARSALPTVANRIAAFSGVGPSTDFGVKPDLTAPGSDIYSGTQRNFSGGAQFDASGFGISQGTSVSSPMVAGAAAIVRQMSPQFTPAQVKSALVQNAAKILTPISDGVSGVMAGGNGLLDLAAAVTTPAVVVPSSITLDASASGAQLSRVVILTITNTGGAADSYQLTATNVPGSPLVDIRFSSTSLSIGPGASATASISFTFAQPLTGIVEGSIELRSQSSGRLLTVPYWGSFTRPVVNLTGVVNAASFSSGSTRLAPGSLISIFGTQLSTTIAAAQFLPLPTALGGVRVLINDVEAPLLFVSPTQINAQVPYEIVNASLGILEVSLHGQTSAAVPFQIAAAAPGIFTLSQTGSGRGTVLHGLTNAPVTDANPARPGEVLAAYVNGLGTTTPAAFSGAAATSTPLQTTTRQPAASIGGINAPVTFSGLAPGFSGLYQVNVQVPESTITGDQPLVITSAGIASNPVTVPVRQ